MFPILATLLASIATLGPPQSAASGTASGWASLAQSPTPGAERGYLGVRLTAADDRGTAIDQGAGIEQGAGIDQGARIEWVEPGSAAERAGLRAGDAITSVDDRPVRSFDDLIEALRPKSPGTSVVLGVRRGAERLDLVATLGRWGPPPAAEPLGPAEREAPVAPWVPGAPGLPLDAERSWSDLIAGQRAGLEEVLGRVRGDLDAARERMRDLVRELEHWRDTRGRELVDDQRERLALLLEQVREQRDRQIDRLDELTEKLADIREKVGERARAWQDFDFAPRHTSGADVAPPSGTLRGTLRGTPRDAPPVAEPPDQPLPLPAQPGATTDEVRALREELGALRAELAELRELLRERR